MIVRACQGDVLTESRLPVAFAVNSQGTNTSGFAGAVAQHYWPDLATIGETELGTLRARVVHGRVFYAMCVHSLDTNGWRDAPAHLASILQEIKLLGDDADPAQWNFAPGRVIAVPWPGTGPVGQLQGADALANLDALAAADIDVEVWTR